MTDAERESLLSQWAKLPGNSEQTQREISERVLAIQSAISDSTSLRSRDIRVSIQGSYRNHTNVRLYTDVDINVCLMDIFTTDYEFAQKYSDKKLGISDAAYTHPRFKNELEAALVSAFGRPSVKRRNAEFRIAQSHRRIDANVVPCIEHRRYRSNGSYYSGTTVHPDTGDAFESWPEQHFQNSVAKNSKTGKRFNQFVRIMKSLCNYLGSQGFPQAMGITSFLNECMVYNTPNNLLATGKLSGGLRETLAYLRHALETDEQSRKWLEITEMNYLFHSSRPWTRESALDWILAAWDWLEYE
ncbi:MAG: nucleotidyltransferase [Proteobacteria bacterium]|nr:nucleotidyltransferase [Pseudomonadota bacterium]